MSRASSSGARRSRKSQRELTLHADQELDQLLYQRTQEEGALGDDIHPETLLAQAVDHDGTDRGNPRATETESQLFDQALAHGNFEEAIQLLSGRKSDRVDRSTCESSDQIGNMLVVRRR